MWRIPPGERTHAPVGPDSFVGETVGMSSPTWRRAHNLQTSKAAIRKRHRDLAEKPGNGYPLHAGNQKSSAGSAPVERALWIDLDELSAHGVSRPTRRFRHCAKVRWCCRSRQWGWETTRYRFNYGANLYQTNIPTINPPVRSLNMRIFQQMDHEPTAMETTSRGFDYRNRRSRSPPILAGRYAQASRRTMGVKHPANHSSDKSRAAGCG